MSGHDNQFVQVILFVIGAFLELAGIPVGLFPDSQYQEMDITLESGDVLVFYTDGITEAMNSDSDLFGDARLARLLAEHGHLDAADLRERILREIESFVGTADQHDDMTMILIKVEEAFALSAPVAV